MLVERQQTETCRGRVLAQTVYTQCMITYLAIAEVALGEGLQEHFLKQQVPMIQHRNFIGSPKSLVTTGG